MLEESAKRKKITLLAEPSEVAKLNLRAFLQISTGMLHAQFSVWCMFNCRASACATEAAWLSWCKESKKWQARGCLGPAAWLPAFSQAVSAEDAVKSGLLQRGTISMDPTCIWTYKWKPCRVSAIFTWAVARRAAPMAAKRCAERGGGKPCHHFFFLCSHYFLVNDSNSSAYKADVIVKLSFSVTVQMPLRGCFKADRFNSSVAIPNALT